MLKTTKATSSVAKHPIYTNSSVFAQESKDSKIKHESIRFTFPTIMEKCS